MGEMGRNAGRLADYLPVLAPHLGNSSRSKGFTGFRKINEMWFTAMEYRYKIVSPYASNTKKEYLCGAAIKCNKPIYSI